MGAFLDKILNLSLKHDKYKRFKALEIVDEINEKIEKCAESGYTEIRIIPKPDIINANELHAIDIYLLEPKYFNDSVIFNTIIDYYLSEGFFIIQNPNMKISWHKKLQDRLNFLSKKV